MKHLKKHFFAALLFAASLTTFAQVGIGTQNPAASLDIVGDPTNSAAMDGVIYPQLTGNQLRTKAYTPTQMGAMVYVTAADTAPAGQTINVTTTGYYAFDGTVWIPSSIRPADIPRGRDFTVTTSGDYMVQPTDVFIEFAGSVRSITSTGVSSFAVITFPPNMPIGRIFHLYHNSPLQYLHISRSQDYYHQRYFEINPETPIRMYVEHGDIASFMHIGNDIYIVISGI